MELTYIHKDCSERLLLIMAGWGMDYRPFESLVAPGYDIAVGWNYTHETIEVPQLKKYREIVVIAWSMGVMEADRILSPLNLPITLAIAVNGTLTPISDCEGIPCSVFEGTLATLSEANVARFNRRMCGGATAYSQWLPVAPQRSLESLRDELKAIGDRASEPSRDGRLRWDMAFVGSRDMIFPTSSQIASWKRYEVETRVSDTPHLPDFDQIIRECVVNKVKVADKFENAREGYKQHAQTQLAVARRLFFGMVANIEQREFDKIIEIGAGNKEFTFFYAPYFSCNLLELWDIASVHTDVTYPGEKVVIDDAEARLFELPSCSVDLVVSASVMQWFNSPATGLRNIIRVLRPGGLAAVSLYVDGTYRSLSDASGVYKNYFSTDTILNALKEDCDIKYLNVSKYKEEFDSTKSLMEHIRLTGVNALNGGGTAAIRKMLSEDSVHTLEYIALSIIIQKK